MHTSLKLNSTHAQPTIHPDNEQDISSISSTVAETEEKNTEPRQLGLTIGACHFLFIPSPETIRGKTAISHVGFQRFSGAERAPLLPFFIGAEIESKVTYLRYN